MVTTVLNAHLALFLTTGLILHCGFEDLSCTNYSPFKKRKNLIDMIKFCNIFNIFAKINL